MTSAAGTIRAVAGSCDVAWVEGPDATGFLQGLVTNDVAALADGGSCPALLLDNTGHVRSQLRVVRGAADAYTLVTEAGRGQGLVALLDEYHFSEDVDVIGPEPLAMVTLLDAMPHALAGADLLVPGEVPGTSDAIGVDAAAIVDAAGLVATPREELEIRRVEAGVMRLGADFDERTLVQEAGLDATAVSFDKGCYLGQETVARIHYRGGVNRRPLGVRLPEPARAGSAVQAGERRVGTLTSVAESRAFGPIGLAIIRREVQPGDVVRVDGVRDPATVVSLPFTDRQAPSPVSSRGAV